jgi:hypothetical protein
MSDTIKARILEHEDAVKVGLVTEHANAKTKEVVRELAPFAVEFLKIMDWRLTEEGGEFTLKIQCATYDAVNDDMDFSAAPGNFNPQYAAIWMALSTFALLVPVVFELN